jgi:hypothetical protein
MITVIKRPPHDLFTFRLFYQLSSKIKVPADKIYTWSPLYETVYHGYLGENNNWVWEYEMDSRQELIKLIQQDVVVFGVKDHLTTGDFNPWLQKTPTLVKYFNDMINTYSDKRFIFFTSMENLESYISEPNAIIVPWGGDITNQKFEYSKLEPVFDKNFNSAYTYVSLNRNKRSHRAFLVSFLHAEGLDQHGLISCMFRKDVENILDYLKWPLDAYAQESVKLGFDLVKKSTSLLTDSREIYIKDGNDNIGNFNDKLRAYYRQTFVEIITETSCTEKCFNLTEKTLNSIYGCNFPILISSPGAVAFLRQMGLDMFDDIIDHSYDLIDNPIDRIQQAIYNNIRLLKDSTYVKQVWKDNQHRFLSNIEFARHKMYNYYHSRAQQQVEKYINDYKL